MDETNLKELRELIEFLKANAVAEFDMERTDLKVRIKFAGEAAPAAPAVDMAQLSRLMATPPSPVAQAAAPVSLTVPAAAQAVAAPVPAAAEEKLHEVKSPIVGTFYDAPSPGSPTFVKVGDHVEVGTVLCIVEAMKLMNEIESDAAGEVVRRIATAGQPVEYGQGLFAIKVG